MNPLHTASRRPIRALLSMTAAAVSFAGACAAPASADVVIGGFNVARGGSAAIDGGSLLDDLRASIASAFPGATFTGSATLTPAFLATADVLFLTSGTGANSAITPLSGSEQAALLAFVRNGGTAILCADNDTFAGSASEPANESLIDPFGIDVAGTGAPWAQSTTVVGPPSSPVLDGPFGTASGWLVGWTGWFTTVPSEAVVLATINQSGLPGLLSFAPHALAACSGAVVIASDSTTFVDGYYAFGSASEVLVLNSIALALEPSCVIGLCGDIDGNGVVNGADLGLLLGAWGSSDRAADLNADGEVTGADLGILLGNWGPCAAE